MGISQLQKDVKQIGFLNYYTNLPRYLVAICIFLFLTQKVQSQIEVSVPFNDGFIGAVGSNAQQANSIQRFSTLPISKISFVQSESIPPLTTPPLSLTTTLRPERQCYFLYTTPTNDLRPFNRGAFELGFRFIGNIRRE
jgi:hypothetical protein